MSGRKDLPEWDDGRTVADMSSVTRGGGLFRRKKPPAAEDENAEAENIPYSAEERRWAVLGALKATLLIACVFLGGLAIVIALLLMIWR